MSKAYIKTTEEKRHEVKITLVDVSSGAAVLGIESNTEEGELQRVEGSRPMEWVLNMGQSVTVVIED